MSIYGVVSKYLLDGIKREGVNIQLAKEFQEKKTLKCKLIDFSKLNEAKISDYLSYKIKHSVKIQRSKISDIESYTKTFVRYMIEANHVNIKIFFRIADEVNEGKSYRISYYIDTNENVSKKMRKSVLDREVFDELKYLFVEELCNEKVNFVSELSAPELFLK